MSECNCKINLDTDEAMEKLDKLQAKVMGISSMVDEYYVLTQYEKLKKLADSHDFSIILMDEMIEITLKVDSQENHAFTTINDAIQWLNGWASFAEYVSPKCRTCGAAILDDGKCSNINCTMEIKSE